MSENLEFSADLSLALVRFENAVFYAGRSDAMPNVSQAEKKKKILKVTERHKELVEAIRRFVRDSHTERS